MLFRSLCRMKKLSGEQMEINKLIHRLDQENNHKTSHKLAQTILDNKKILFKNIDAYNSIMDDLLELEQILTNKKTQPIEQKSVKNNTTEFFYIDNTIDDFIEELFCE